MKARDIMTKTLVVVEESLSVAKAVKTMIKEKVSSLIVDRSDADDTYGIVTRRDVVNKVVSLGIEPSQITVAEIMTKPLLTISPNLAIKHVARLMVHTGVRRMPVFDGHKIVGIVSNSDVFRGFANHLRNEETFLR